MKKNIWYILLTTSSLYSAINYIQIDNRSSTQFFIPTHAITIPAASQKRIDVNAADMPYAITLTSASHTIEISLQNATRRTIFPSLIPAPESCSMLIGAALIQKKDFLDFCLDFDTTLMVSKRIPSGNILLIIFDENDPYANWQTLQCGPYALHGYVIKDKISHNFLLVE